MVPEKNPIKKQGATETPSVQSSAHNSPQKASQQTGGIRPLKTYLTDVQTAIKEQNESLAKIAIAERDRREARKDYKPEKKELSSQQKKMMIIAGSVLALIVVLGGGYSAIRFFNVDFRFPGLGKPIVDIRGKITTPSILQPSHEKEISVSDLTFNDLVSATNQEVAIERSANSLENIFFSMPFVAPIEGVVLGKETVSAQEFFSLYLSNAPDILTRTLAPQFMFGLHYDATQTGNVFLILKTTSFETALAGMLKWEKTMVNDIGPLLNVKSGDTQGFKDIVIQNNDTRALLDRSREPVLIYSFVDRNTILITSNRGTLGNILSLLNKK